ncbi:major facilitator superfamily domain-containing protein [Leucosporidium creatinivorum]|uniref:Major facilitator superfamily domain-containing protein n=1 Tax=Leucosporidium creatinivorum TaxID=106004 RepID=A0A1Y2CJ72_9BASI|nr:major facilitator superfamily domain-containing protein [Leucosporidium creatinivorum]
MASTSARSDAIELNSIGTRASSLQTGEDSAADEILQASKAQDASVPEGGYGWVVVAGCAVICFWFVGTSYSWGILQAALVEEKLAPATSLSFVGSLAVFFIAGLALVNARLIRLIGARNTGLLGIAFLGGSEILSGFATKSLPGLFVTSGVGMGIGTSLCFMTVSVTPAQWFAKKRGLATGIVYAAGGLGGTVIAFMFDGLIQRLGIAWTFRLCGLLTLGTGLPAAWLIKERSAIRTATFVEWRLFRDPIFLLLFLAAAIATFPLFVPPFFLPLYASSLGLSASAGAGLVAGFNFSSAVGRLSCGFMCDKLGAVNTLLFSLAISAGSMLVLWPLSDSIAPLVAFAVINGVGNGGFFAVIPSVVGSVFGSARMGVAMGMIVSGWAGGYLLGAPIAGYLLAAFGGQDGGLRAYLPAIMYAGGLSLLAGALVATARFKMDRKVLKKL